MVLHIITMPRITQKAIGVPSTGATWDFMGNLGHLGNLFLILNIYIVTALP